MKKSLVLAMAMAVGLSASAYAANPFTDVPAGHWAYDSISKLAAAGVIEGYGDDTFRGDRLMTRYEMAQIVAKAMAKGANVDKLAAEFADELDALGVRVAALEKKSDNVKITGHVRWRWSRDSGNNLGTRIVNHDLRTRLWFNGQINDNWKYVGMIQNVQNFRNYIGDENGANFTFQRAYVEGRLGGMQVTAGRHDFQLGDANLYDTRMDGIKIAYGDKVKFGAYYGKPSDTGAIFDFNNDGVRSLYGRFYGANIGADINKLSLNLAYDKFDKAKRAGGVASNMKNNGVFSIGATYDFGKATLGAIYLKSNVDPRFNGRNISSNGFVITGTYGGAENDKVGSFGFVAKYYNQGAGTFIAHTMNGGAMDFVDQGFKGYSLSGSVTIAKNMIATVEWYDIKGKETGRKERTVWTEIGMSF